MSETYPHIMSVHQITEDGNDEGWDQDEQRHYSEPEIVKESVHDIMVLLNHS